MHSHDVNSLGRGWFLFCFLICFCAEHIQFNLLGLSQKQSLLKFTPVLFPFVRRQSQLFCIFVYSSSIKYWPLINYFVHFWASQIANLDFAGGELKTLKAKQTGKTNKTKTHKQLKTKHNITNTKTNKTNQTTPHQNPEVSVEGIGATEVRLSYKIPCSGLLHYSLYCFV